MGLEHRWLDAEATATANQFKYVCAQCGAIEIRERRFHTTYGASGRAYRETSGMYAVQAALLACPGPRHHWDEAQRAYVQPPQRVSLFLKEFEALCKKYNVSIAHEDNHGAFILEPFSAENIDWLQCALLDLGGHSPKKESA